MLDDFFLRFAEQREAVQMLILCGMLVAVVLVCNSVAVVLEGREKKETR